MLSQDELHPVSLRPIKVSHVQGLEQYRDDGFEGFLPVSILIENTNDIPDEPGVYVVIRTSGSDPQFLVEGTGGFFKGKNPNISIQELKVNYVEDAQTVYIGKAGTSLRKRIVQLLRFGEGAAVGHWGGRYLWQLADAEKLYIAWKTTPGCDPRIIEAQMIQEFVSLHGKRPFANLKD